MICHIINHLKSEVHLITFLIPNGIGVETNFCVIVNFGKFLAY